MKYEKVKKKQKQRSLRTTFKVKDLGCDTIAFTPTVPNS